MTKRSREMKRSKKVLLSMGVLTVVGALAGAGTFASFSAQTTNPANVFASGTLVLSDTVNEGTACYSTAGGLSTGITDNNLDVDCDQNFSVSVRKPGDSFTSRLKIKNEGSVGASQLTLFSSACTPSDAAGELFNGTADPCDAVQIYVQQYSDSGYTLPTQCVYGGAVVAGTCDFSDLTKTLEDFAGDHGSLGTGISEGTFAAGATSYYRIGVKLPTATGNAYQGRAATMDLSWHMVQVAGAATGT